MDVDDDDQDDFLERPYQTVLAEQAYASNRILFLPTGSGKTFIAIMVLKRLFHLLEPEFCEGGKRAVFLVNTVALVEQQAAVLERHLYLDGVGMYSGDMNVDFWNLSMWREEFQKFQVMVMTAEILNQLLLKKYISLSNLALVILDECHHAVEDHPMRQIMRLFEDCPKEDQPRVIGLTATLLNGTPKTLPRVRDEVKKLEVTLHSTVATVNSWEIVKQFSTKPRERLHKFTVSSNRALIDLIGNKIDEVHMMCKKFPFVTESSCQIRYIEGFIPLKTAKKNDVANLMVQVSKQLGWLGPYGCLKTLQAIYVTLKLLQQKMADRQSHMMIHTLVCLLLSLSRHLDVFMLQRGCLPENEKAYHNSSPKVQLLVKLLESHYQECNSKPEDEEEPMQALVFVEEKMTAKILCSVLKNIARNSDRYGFIKAAFIVGGSSNPFNESWEGTFNKNINDHIVQRFRQREINVLVATDVLEEGIDIPACNIVVRFDQAKSFRSYVQSKGRARHSTSLFALMVEESEVHTYHNKITYFKQIEQTLECFLVGHTDDRLSPSDRELEDLYESEVEPYYTSVGSKVTMTSSISLVNGYCMFLAHDRFSKVSPTWHRNKNLGQHIVVAMQLPRLSPMQDIIKGKPMSSLKIAKRAAALEVCKRLHEVGELNDYLMPNEKCLEESDMNELLPLWEKEDQVAGSTAKTGTKNRTRTYPLPVPLCFEDCSPTPQMKMYVHHIEIYPDYEDPYTDLKKSTIYHVLKERKNFALISSKPLNQVCQFPVFSKFGAVSVKVTSMHPVCLSEHQLMEVTLFHWNLFTSMVPVAKSFLVYSKESYLVAATKHDAVGCIVFDWAAMKACGTDYKGGDIPEKCVASPTHRGSTLHEVYFVTRICEELNGHSPFPNTMYKSYDDYFQRKHSLKLVKPALPLLEVQPFKRISNDLLPRLKSGGNGDENGTIHFPSELCQVECIDGCLYLKATLLPSILHRLDRFLIADQLCRIIQTSVPHGSVPHDCSLKKAIVTTSAGAGSSNNNSRVKPCVSFVKHESSTKKRRLSSAPWGTNEEPVDIEHEFETATTGDIEKYSKFFQKKVSSDNFRARNKVSVCKRKLPTLQDGEETIKLLKERKNILYPCHIMEATTAVSADDIVNLERLETLGDAFLKFAVSFMLFNRFPELAEGKLTQVKGQILGNRNLYYCAQAKQLGHYMKVHKMVPSEQWVPPSFSVPNEVFDNNLEHMVRYLSLTKDEQFNSALKKNTLNDVKMLSLKQLELSGISHPSNFFGVNQQGIPDKTISDCVEALIGVFLQSSGPQAAMHFLEYMQVLPPNSKALLQIFPKQSQYSRSFDVTLNRTVGKVADLLGYRFKNTDLLIEALTHASSTSSARTYERLEFIGDALLDFLITAFIYENCGKLSPGELTDLRSALVNNITFACFSVRYDLHKLMNQGSIPLMDAIDRFVRFQDNRDHVIDEEILILLEEDECKIAETVDVPKALGDLFEAMIGAVFIDSGGSFPVVWKVIYRLMKNEIRYFSQKVPKQVVRLLYEAVGEHHISFRVSESTREMALVQVHGVLDVQIKGEVRSFHGFGVNKAAAKKSAAKLALRQLLIE